MTESNCHLRITKPLYCHCTNGAKLVDEVGLEPTMPEAEDLQSSGVTNFPTHPY